MADDPDKKTADSSMVLMQWQAPEFTYYPKDQTWYFWLFFVTAVLLGFIFYTHNYTFGLVIVLSSLLVFSWGRKKPRIVNFAVTKQGVAVGEKLYRFPELESFWIFYEPVTKELSIKSKKKILHFIKIPLGRENPAQVRKVLVDFLPEEVQEESLFDSLTRLSRF